MKKIICIGGWGHWFEVFQHLQNRADFLIAGIAPAFDGETLAPVRNHPLMANAPLFKNMDDLINQTGSDIAIISTRPGHIARAVIQAAEAGLDIISEKPLGNSLEENQAIEAAVRKNRVRLIAILSMRALPEFQTARRLVLNGIIGKPVLVHAQKSYKYGERPEWFATRNEYCGTFPWIGIHALDMIHFTTGLKAVQATAVQKNMAHPSRPACEDACCGVFELENGAMATVNIDYFRPAGTATHNDDFIRIVGTKGVIEAKTHRQTVTLIHHENGEQNIPLDPAASLFAPFFDGTEGLTGTEDALQLSRACLYARLAADENKTIKIPTEVVNF